MYGVYSIKKHDCDCEEAFVMADSKEDAIAKAKESMGDGRYEVKHYSPEELTKHLGL